MVKPDKRVSLAPLTPEQAIRAAFQVKPRPKPVKANGKRKKKGQ